MLSLIHLTVAVLARNDQSLISHDDINLLSIKQEKGNSKGHYQRINSQTFNLGIVKGE